MKLKTCLDFFEFIVDRQRIYCLKSTGEPKPWTDDKILQTYKFCNVYRELDKCTIYLSEHIKTLTIEEKLFRIILFRRFNKSGLFDLLDYHPGDRFDAEGIIKRLDGIRKTQPEVKFFNDAYTLCQYPYNRKIRMKDKHVQILLSMKDLKKEMRLVYYIWDAQKLFEKLQFPGHPIGPFLAYQIMQDLAYTGYPINGFENFTYVGPGARPAVDLIFPGNGVFTSGGYAEACRVLRNYQMCAFATIKSNTGKKWSKYAAPFQPFLSLHNVQASLCEFRKYTNLKKGKGRRRLYK